MTTYIFGAGASRHAGYPLTPELWPRLLAFAEKAEAPPEATRAVRTVTALLGLVADVEASLTSLHTGSAPFHTFDADERCSLMVGIRSGIVALWRETWRTHPQPTEYERFAKLVRPGDVVVTFNYDIAVDSSLAKAGLFHAPHGYCFPDLDERDSKVSVLKPHGSVNWIGCDSGQMTGNMLRDRPLVDNRVGYLPGHNQEILEPGEYVTGPTGLILPMHSKRFSVTTNVSEEWVAFYDHLWTRVAETLARSDEIVVIGYSMPKADNRACGAILHHANKKALIRVVCGDSSEEISDRFFEHGFLRVRSGGFFEDFLDLKSMRQFAGQ